MSTLTPPHTTHWLSGSVHKAKLQPETWTPPRAYVSPYATNYTKLRCPYFICKGCAGLINIAHSGILCDHVPDWNIDGFNVFSLAFWKATSKTFRALKFFAFLIRSFKKIQIINLLPQLFYERISAEVFHATTFHGLWCRRCTGHLSCCKRYRRDSNTDYISVGRISNPLRCHYATIPYANGRIWTHRPFGPPVFKTVCL